MQNIQNMFQNYGFGQGNTPAQDRSNATSPYKAGTLNNTTQVSAFNFTFNVQRFTKSEINDQGQNLSTFSIEELHISISEIQIKATTAESQQAGSATEGQESAQNDYWGIGQTSDRLADFVINGGGEDLNRLKQGREGILQGLNEAEKMWGGELPEISYKTIEATLAKIDARIHELGGSVIDIAA